MIHHGASCLQGPIAEPCARWQQADVESVFSADCDDNNKEIRHDLVARVRRAIADGTYDTPEKMDIALQRLLEDLE